MPNPLTDAELSRLLAHARTPAQQSAIEAIRAHGGIRKAAAVLGCAKSTLDRHLDRVRARAASRGYAPDADLAYPIPDGQKLKGISTLIDKRDGTAVLQWVKTSEDAARQEEIFREVFVALAEELPRYDPVPMPADCDAALLTAYVITDYHLGMLAWGEETGGADWDLKQAEETLWSWFSVAIERAPAARSCVLAQLGDFLHWDGFDAVTPTHKNGYS